MTRQYTRRDPATPADSTDAKPEDKAAEEKAVEKTTDDTTADTKTEGTDAPKPAKKPRTRSQIARDKAAAEAKDREAAVLETSPLWQVIYPTGASLYRPDDDEIVVDVNGTEHDIEVVDGFARVPMNARVRAVSMQELSNFADLASQGFLRQVLDPSL